MYTIDIAKLFNNIWRVLMKGFVGRINLFNSRNSDLDNKTINISELNLIDNEAELEARAKSLIDRRWSYITSKQS